MSGKYLKSTTAALAITTMLSVSSTAWAQQQNEADEDLRIDRVFVTATKQGESDLNDIPVSITAIGQQDIEDAGMDDFLDYVRQVPGLGFQSLSEAGGRDDIRGGRRLNMRGIESGFDGVPTVAYYINDAPVPAMDPKLFDIERVEVLRGPQGTLYGANSMGGTIRLVLNSPVQNELDFRGDVSVSSTEDGEPSYGVNAMTNIPLIEDKLALRAVGFYRFGGGYIDNVLLDGSAGTSRVDEDINDETSYGGRLALEFRPIPELSITPSVFFQETRLPYNAAYDSAFGDLQVYNRQVEANRQNIFTLYSNEIEWDVGAWTIFSSTSYFESDFDSVEDNTLSYLNRGDIEEGQLQLSLQAISSERFTQEIRASYGGDRWSGVIGAFYLDEDRYFQQDYPRADGDPTLPSFFYGTQSNTEEQFAVFGEATYDLTERLSATAGIRWFDSSQSQNTQWYISGVLDPYLGSGSASDYSPKFQLSYDLNDEQMIYVSATKGFRPGGAAGAIPEDVCASDLAELGLSSAPEDYDPDELWSYEAGAKLGFGQLASLNVAVYYIDWTNVQQTTLLADCGFTFIGNVGGAESRGVEAEFTLAPTDNLTLSGSLGYTDASFTVSNPVIDVAAGDPLPLVPEWTASLSARYDFVTPMGTDAYVLADVSYKDETLNGYSSHMQDAYTLANARLGVELTEQTEISFFVDNVFNERPQHFYYLNETVGSLPSTLLETTITQRPRTVGVKLSFDL